LRKLRRAEAKKRGNDGVESRERRAEGIELRAEGDSPGV